jgi:hypothetical protein
MGKANNPAPAPAITIDVSVGDVILPMGSVITMPDGSTAVPPADRGSVSFVTPDTQDNLVVTIDNPSINDYRTGDQYLVTITKKV